MAGGAARGGGARVAPRPVSPVERRVSPVALRGPLERADYWPGAVPEEEPEPEGPEIAIGEGE